MQKNTKIILVIVLIILIAILLILVKQAKTPFVNKNIQITNFEECVAAGNPIMESYPQQCRANNQTFVQNIGNELAKTDLIRIDNPRPNQRITSPLKITGQAIGYWFFEGDFPARLYDANKKEIAAVPVRAIGEWMTEDFVKFAAELIFTKPNTATGTLILTKDNPSGLPANDDQLRIPVKF